MNELSKYLNAVPRTIYRHLDIPQINASCAQLHRSAQETLRCAQDSNIPEINPKNILIESRYFEDDKVQIQRLLTEDDLILQGVNPPTRTNHGLKVRLEIVPALKTISDYRDNLTGLKHFAHFVNTVESLERHIIELLRRHTQFTMHTGPAENFRYDTWSNTGVLAIDNITDYQNIINYHVEEITQIKNTLKRQLYLELKPFWEGQANLTHTLDNKLVDSAAMVSLTFHQLSS